MCFLGSCLDLDITLTSFPPLCTFNSPTRFKVTTNANSSIVDITKNKDTIRYTPNLFSLSDAGLSD